MAENAAPSRSWSEALAVYMDRRAVVMLFLGFSAGLPYFLIFDTLSAWLRQAGLSLELIAFFSLATLAYAFKFLWAPLVDRTAIPGLTRLLGHRRSWMLVVQGVIIAGLWLVASSDPTRNLPLMAAFAVMTGFASATQDIVIDAWRIEAASDTEQGVLAATYAWGYRVAMVVAGALPLVLADVFSWSLSYAVMGALMSIGVLAVLFAPRETAHEIRSIPGNGLPVRPVIERAEWSARFFVLVVGALFLGTGLSGNTDVLALTLPSAAAAKLTTAWSSAYGPWLQLGSVIVGFGFIVLSAWPLPGKKTRPGLFLFHAFGDPLVNFLSRFGRTAGLIIALICVYRISDFVLNLMNPFYIDLGFSLTEIAEVRKIFGTVMTVLGVFAAGYAIVRWGIMKPLIVGAFAGPLSNLVFAWLATQGASIPALTIAIGLDNVAMGFSGTCLIAYMSSLTAEGFTATQYALFTSLYAIPGKLLASQSGRIVESAAVSAHESGLFAPLKSLFASLPTGALSSGAANAGVSPQALGAGYTVFFMYSFLIGLIAIVLTFMVAARQR